MTVSGNLVYAGATTSSGNNNPGVDNAYYLGNTTNRWIGNFSSLSANGVTIGNSTVNASINSIAFTGSANNSTNFAGQPQSYYANATSPTFSSSIGFGDFRKEAKSFICPPSSK